MNTSLFVAGAELSRNSRFSTMCLAAAINPIGPKLFSPYFCVWLFSWAFSFSLNFAFSFFVHLVDICFPPATSLGVGMCPTGEG